MERKAKWWGESITIWGAILTAATAVLPAAGPLIGVDISGNLAGQLGTQLTSLVQTACGLAGTVMTVYGRVRAIHPLVRRPMTFIV